MPICVGEHLVKATHFLEGDGPLVFSCYEKLKAVAEASQALHFPNVRPVVAAITNEDLNQSAAALEQRPRHVYIGFYGSSMWILTMQLRSSKLALQG